MGEAPLRIRLAAPADVPAIVALVNGAYRGDDGRHGWTSEHALVAGPRIDAPRLLALLERPGSLVLLAEGDRGIVGSVHLQDGKTRGECEVGMLSVHVDGQTNGVGRALLAAAEPVARERWQARTMVLHVVSVRSELLAWYERRGYRRTGRLVPFPDGPTERFLQGPLSFERLEKLLA